MPLIFVHGVNVRYDPRNDPFITARDAFFRTAVLTHLVSTPSNSLILNPYWGEAAASFPWNHGGLPEGRYERFGVVDCAAAGVIQDLATTSLMSPENLYDVEIDAILLTLARHSLQNAVDRLFVVAAIHLPPRIASSYVEFALAIASHVASDSRPTWLSEVSTDAEFLETLFHKAQAHFQQPRNNLEVFGPREVLDCLKTASEEIRDSYIVLVKHIRQLPRNSRQKIRHWLEDLIINTRSPAHRTVATFIGDAFVYFNQRNQKTNRQLISNKITAALDEAEANRRQNGEPLILVGHSMGGNIAYDIITSIRSNLLVDVFVTVGSQIAVLEELKLFVASDPSIPGQAKMKVSRPPNIKRWVNIFDITDILSFSAGKVFELVEDYHFATGYVWAHGGYFVEPMFYERLGQRLSVKQ